MNEPEACGHCGRPITQASRGIAAAGTVLCHTGTLPPDADPADCYRLVTVYQHAADGSCCYTDEAKLANFYDNVDTSTLDGEEVECEASVSPRVSYAASFDRGDARELARIAREQGISAGDLICRWVLERLRPAPAPKVNISMGPAVQPLVGGIDPAVIAQAIMWGRRQGRYEAGS